MITAATTDLAVPLAVDHLQKHGIAYPPTHVARVQEWFRRHGKLPAAASSTGG
jgi:hypothetical protein